MSGYPGYGIIKLRKFLFSYQYKGEHYTFDVPAYTREEAQDRVDRMVWAKYDGEVEMEIPAYSGIGAWVRLVVMWKNLWRRL